MVFDDRQVEYTFDLLGQLELAYAMTVHKSQGQRVPGGDPVGLAGKSISAHPEHPVHGGDPCQRAADSGGRPRCVQQMVENNRQSRRYSGLKLRLEKDG